jgi:hypothetical protein
MRTPADAHEGDPDLLVTSPAILVSYVASILGALVPISVFIAIMLGSPTRPKTPLHLGILSAMMAVGFLWSALSYRSLRSTPAGLRLISGLPPFRRTRAIPFAAVRRAYITDYFPRLILELDSNARVTVANSYAFPRSPLPTVEPEPHEPRGAYQRLKSLKVFIETRLPTGTPG